MKTDQSKRKPTSHRCARCGADFNRRRDCLDHIKVCDAPMYWSGTVFYGSDVLNWARDLGWQGEGIVDAIGFLAMRGHVVTRYESPNTEVSGRTADETNNPSGSPVR